MVSHVAFLTILICVIPGYGMRIVDEQMLESLKNENEFDRIRRASDDNEGELDNHFRIGRPTLRQLYTNTEGEGVPFCDFLCQDDSGDCQPKEYVCDHIMDCGDGSDELNCGTSVFKEIMLGSLKNKNKLDRKRRSFEDNNDQRVPFCDFHCLDDSSDCLPKEYECDDIMDCRDGSDELNCDINMLREAQHENHDNREPVCDFHCASAPRVCIPIEWECDGKADCEDGSDEDNCIASMVRESQDAVMDQREPCLSPYAVFGKQCVIVIEVKQTWMEARDHCAKLGLGLLEIREETVTPLKTYLSDVYQDLYDIWIGASDIQKEGRFTWNSGRTVDLSWGWGIGQPNNWEDDENCVEFSSNYDAKMNDANCNELNYFACEKI
ncbi:unnamed protein product [Meganyctiphanes norvegica]|uniref:C-type lectin domain-containing protein n=1 Tax=Meganyctiphanes norvegica TaxID=48144 RepID=A0AAV2RST2_MEGNR